MFNFKRNAVLAILTFVATTIMAATYIRPPALIEDITSTATAAGTTTLTAASNTNQQFTGSTTQNVKLPVATTLDTGRRFYIMNRSSGIVTVQYQDGSTALSLAPNFQSTFILQSKGTSNGTWDFSPVAITGIGTANGLSVSGASISLGTASTSTTGALTSTDWNTFNGKQGALSFSSPLVNTSGTVALQGATGYAFVGSGGTGATTLQYTAANTGSTLVSRDANGNATINNLLQGFSGNACAGTITLTVASTQLQRFSSGAGSCTVVLPDATTLANNTEYGLDNDASGTVTVQDNTGATLYSIPAGGFVTVILESNSFQAGQWAAYIYGPSGANWGTSGLNAGGTLTGTQLISNIATGTAPLSVTSTTRVSNLNVATAGTADAWTTARNLAGNSVNGSANVAFSNKFVVQGTTDSGLSGAQFLGALGTGIVKNTTTTGVLSIAGVSDVTGLFSSCSGSQYLGYDGNCHTANSGTVTSVATTAPLSGGTITSSGTISLGSVGGNIAIVIPPNIQRFTSGTTTYYPTYAFIISSGSATAGATYTNNSVTFTVSNTISSQTILYATASGAPTASGTLTKSGGTGDSTITFSSYALPIAIEVTAIGAGGGASGSGTGSSGYAGTSGNQSTFGTTLVVGNGGTGGYSSGGGAPGGSGVVGTGVIAETLVTGGHGGDGNYTGSTGTYLTGGSGGNSCIGGGAGGGSQATVYAGAANSGGGGGGAGTNATNSVWAGGGGGAGGCAIGLITRTSSAWSTVAAGVSAVVAASANGGNAGTSGAAGGAGGSGLVTVKEMWQ